MIKLLTDVEVAEAMQLELDEFHVLRKRYGWPVTKLGRFKFRFTEEQVAQIVAMQSREPERSAPPAPAGPVEGQTKRSAARRTPGGGRLAAAP